MVGLLLRHHLPLPLLLGLAVLVAATRADPSGDVYNTSICKPYICGDVNISYPFYLSGDMADVLGNKASCGYPGLAIGCLDNNYPIMQLGGSGRNPGYPYNVTGVNYTSSTIYLADPEVLGDESCPRVDHNVTVPSSFWLNTVRYLLIFADCPFSSFLYQPANMNILPITCASYAGVGGYSFVIPSEVPYQAFEQQCSPPILVPVLQNASLTIDPQWSTNGFRNALTQGFQMELNLSQRSQECTKCENSTGQCAYSKDGVFEACLCSDGRAQAHDCTNVDGDGKAGGKTDGKADGKALFLSCITFSISFGSKLLTGSISLRLHHFLGSC